MNSSSNRSAGSSAGTQEGGRGASRLKGESGARTCQRWCQPDRRLHRQACRQGCGTVHPAHLLAGPPPSPSPSPHPGAHPRVPSGLTPPGRGRSQTWALRGSGSRRSMSQVAGGSGGGGGRGGGGVQAHEQDRAPGARPRLVRAHAVPALLPRLPDHPQTLTRLAVPKQRVQAGRQHGGLHAGRRAGAAVKWRKGSAGCPTPSPSSVQVSPHPQSLNLSSAAAACHNRHIATSRQCPRCPPAPPASFATPLAACCRPDGSAAAAAPPLAAAAAAAAAAAGGGAAAVWGPLFAGTGCLHRPPPLLLPQTRTAAAAARRLSCCAASPRCRLPPPPPPRCPTQTTPPPWCHPGGLPLFHHFRPTLTPLLPLRRRHLLLLYRRRLLRAAAAAAAAALGAVDAAAGPPGPVPRRRTWGRGGRWQEMPWGLLGWRCINSGLPCHTRCPGRSRLQRQLATSKNAPCGKPDSRPNPYRCLAAASCARRSMAVRSMCWHCCPWAGPSGSALPSTDNQSCWRAGGRGQ